METPARTADDAAFTSRDLTVSSVWRDLNKVALRVGAGAGFAASAGYLVAFFTTSDRSFLMSAALTLLVGLSAVYSGHKAQGDVEPLILMTGLAVVGAGTLPEAGTRGGLWGVIAILGVMGSLLLPDHKQLRLRIWIGLLLASQCLYPVFGVATAAGALSAVIVSTVSTAVGMVIVATTKRALTRSEDYRIQLFRSVPVGLFRCSPDGALIDVNPALTQMLGYTASADLVGRQISSLHEEPREWDTLAELLVESSEPQRFAHRMTHRDGKVLWLRGFGQAVRDDDSVVVYHEGSVEDITQRREAEEAARQTTDRFQLIFERAPIAIWEEDFADVGERLEELRASGVSDLRSYLGAEPDEARHLAGLIKFTNVNPAGISLIGATTKEEALALVAPRKAPAAVVQGYVDELMAIWNGEDNLLVEVKGATADGEVTDLALSWAVPRHADGSLHLARAVVAIQDIAIVKEAERELAALVKSKDDLIAAVSHELRTPITTILGMSTELHDHGASFSAEETSDLIGMIADQSRELANIVQDLLVAARAEAGTLAIKLAEVNVAAEVARILPTEAGAVAVTIDQSAFAWADPLRLRQILRNLLTNAARYGGDRVSIDAEPVGDLIAIRVQDNGAGISPDEHQSIFEPYVRSAGDAALPGSLGLGLPVSRNLARLMGGDLVYRFDGSSVFELTLPLTTAPKTD